MTTVDEVMAQLEKLGKPQTAAIYKRHGGGDNVFGVLTSELVKVQKKIKRDHALALRLWKTGNGEARILALLVADPEKLTVAEADGFVNDADSYYVGCYIGPLVGRSPLAEGRMRAWMTSPKEFVRECGYMLFGWRLKDDPDSIRDGDCEAILRVIEKEIHGSPNRARYAMNGAVIGIGVYKPSLRRKAVAAAKRIGKVEVDHGETSCKTPDAVTYIAKASKHGR